VLNCHASCALAWADNVMTQINGMTRGVIMDY